MSEWIEFKRMNGDGGVYPSSVRAYAIEAVDKISDGSCKVYLDEEHHYSYTVAEPYEEMVKKIKDAEETPAPVVERFNDEQYAMILRAVENEKSDCDKDSHAYLMYSRIEKDLKEILGE